MHTKTGQFNKKRSSKQDTLEENLVKFLKRSEEPICDEDKSFLYSLLPTLRNFNHDQKLQFRIEVLNLMVKIKNSQPPAIVTQEPYPSNNIIYLQRPTSSASSTFTSVSMSSPGAYDIPSPPSNASQPAAIVTQGPYPPNNINYLQLPTSSASSTFTSVSLSSPGAYDIRSPPSNASTLSQLPDQFTHISEYTQLP